MNYGVIISLWRILDTINLLQDKISEYFTLYKLYEIVILVSTMEDERVFSSLCFIKNKINNSLDKNLENYLRKYILN